MEISEHIALCVLLMSLVNIRAHSYQEFQVQNVLQCPSLPQSLEVRGRMAWEGGEERPRTKVLESRCLELTEKG